MRFSAAHAGFLHGGSHHRARYEDPARDLVELAVEEANQSFRNSGLGFIRLELVHAYETNYVESGSHFEHVWRFADKGDGYMERVDLLGTVGAIVFSRATATATADDVIKKRSS